MAVFPNICIFHRSPSHEFVTAVHELLLAPIKKEYFSFTSLNALAPIAPVGVYALLSRYIVIRAALLVEVITICYHLLVAQA